MHDLEREVEREEAEHEKVSGAIDEIDYMVRRFARPIGNSRSGDSCIHDLADQGHCKGRVFLKIQSTEHSTHVIPQALSVGAIALGIILIGAGIYGKR